MVRNYKRKTEDRWSKEDLLEALTSIKECKLKINDAARRYRISRATLYRQFKKFLQAGGKCDVNQFRTCGGNPILTKVEEDVLEKTIRDLREQGFTVTSSDIKRICFEYCDSNGIPNQFNQEKRMASDDWYYGFLKRHPDVRVGKIGSSTNPKSDDSSGEGNFLMDDDDIIPKGKKKIKKKGVGKKDVVVSTSKARVGKIESSTNPKSDDSSGEGNFLMDDDDDDIIPKKKMKRVGKKDIVAATSKARVGKIESSTNPKSDDSSGEFLMDDDDIIPKKKMKRVGKKDVVVATSKAPELKQESEIKSEISDEEQDDEDEDEDEEQEQDDEDEDEDDEQEQEQDEDDEDEEQEQDDDEEDEDEETF